MEQINKMTQADTIAAVSTPNGTGGIAVIRISGSDALRIVSGAWIGKNLADMETHKATLGKYVATSGEILDEAVATVFRNPKSFTGEDVVELSVHGSRWIQREILSDPIRRGARTAMNGEFTQRAFINGRIDLAQAEGIADLIASSSKASHALAISQTRGRFSQELDDLRNQLIDFASLLELELDFSEEDVEFADRIKLLLLAEAANDRIRRLTRSYSAGSVIKDGLPVVIAGVPNAGKSSLLNLMIGEDKAIVTDIPGTTRDLIEDTIEIDGILFRLTDTAGLRVSNDIVEATGIEKAKAKMRASRIVIWMLDPSTSTLPQIEELKSFISEQESSKIIILCNKCDIEENISKVEALELTIKELADNAGKSAHWIADPIRFSAKTGEGIDILHETLSRIAQDGIDIYNEPIVTNARHYEALYKGQQALTRAIAGIKDGLTADFISQDVRETLHHIGTITGSITTPDLLSTIFSRFCIGK